jgi:hypothetical protein
LKCCHLYFVVSQRFSLAFIYDVVLATVDDDEEVATVVVGLLEVTDEVVVVGLAEVVVLGLVVVVGLGEVVVLGLVLVVFAEVNFVDLVVVVEVVVG